MMIKYVNASIFFFLMIFVNTVFAGITIDSFDAKPKSGEAPLKVTLTCNANTTSGNIVEFRWDIDGDGTPENIDTRSTTISTYIHTYRISGTYTPICTVVDSSGSIVSSQPLTIFAYSCDGIKGDYNNNGTLGLEDCIGILQELTK